MEVKTAYVSSLSDFQKPTSSFPSSRSEPYVQPPSVFEYTLPKQYNKRPFWSFGSAKDLGANSENEIKVEGSRPGTASRKPTLVYDPDFPTQPPQFVPVDRATNDFLRFDGKFEGNQAREIDGRGPHHERVTESEKNDFSGFDEDFSSQVVSMEDKRERREDMKRGQRETIGAAI